MRFQVGDMAIVTNQVHSYYAAYIGDVCEIIELHPFVCVETQQLLPYLVRLSDGVTVGRRKHIFVSLGVTTNKKKDPGIVLRIFGNQKN